MDPTDQSKKIIIDLSEEEEEEEEVKEIKPISPLRKKPHISVSAAETGESSSSSVVSFNFGEICQVPKFQNDRFSIYNCSDCLKKFLFSETQYKTESVCCPEPRCKGVLEPQFCCSEGFDHFDDALSEVLLDGSLKFECPFKDCSGILVDDGEVASIKESECPYCHRLFCAQCRVPWHSGIECEEFQKLNEKQSQKEETMTLEIVKKSELQRSHLCRFIVEGSEICLRMICRGCNKKDKISIEECTQDEEFLKVIMASILKAKKVIDISQEVKDTTIKETRLTTATLRNRPSTALSITTTGESSNSKDSSFMCEICAELKSQTESFTIKGCTHYFCSECMVKYVALKIQENITLIRCPEPDCKAMLEPQFCRSILPREVFDRWVDALCEAFILGSQRFYCPYKDCSAPLMDDGDGGTIIEESECPYCHRLFCAQCKVPWHPGLECVEFQKLNENERGKEDLMVMDLARERQWQRCPMCRFYVERIEGCLYIKCRCGFAFCYKCAAPMNDHYCYNCKS